MGFGTGFAYDKSVTYNNKCCFQKLSMHLISPGATRCGSVKTGGFVRPANLHKPRIPVETKQMHDAIWSRLHRRSARDHFSWSFLVKKCFMSLLYVQLQQPRGVLINTVSSMCICSIWDDGATTNIVVLRTLKQVNFPNSSKYEIHMKSMWSEKCEINVKYICLHICHTLGCLAGALVTRKCSPKGEIYWHTCNSYFFYMLDHIISYLFHLLSYFSKCHEQFAYIPGSGIHQSFSYFF